MVQSNHTMTIKDVAKRAGTSTATVSHVLNKTRFVSEDLTHRVNDAIAELGYYPNLLVGSLRKNKSFTVGCVLSSISNETFGLMVETIQKILFSFGYNLIICNTSYDASLEREALNTLLMKKVDAIIAIPTSRTGEKFKEIQDMGVPIVMVDRSIPELATDTVRFDNVEGTYAAINHLVGLGHRHIGYIDRKVDQSHSLDQIVGYKKALEEHGISFNPGYIRRASGFTYQAGAEAAKELIKRNPDLTAIFAYYDITAIGAMRGIFDLGFRVPEDFSVVGFDGMPVTEVTWPRLTTMEVPVNRMARAACDLVMKRLEQGANNESHAVKPKDIVIVPKLVVRDSTSKPRTEKTA